MADEDKSQPGSPKRREQARERGQVVRSRDLPSALALLAVASLLRWGQSGWVPVWRDLLRHLLAASSRSDMRIVTPLLNWTAWGVIRWAAPAMAAAWGISLFGMVAQSGFVFSPKAMELSFSRFNPVNNVSRIFSFGGLSPLLKSLIPLSFLAYLGSSILLREWYQIMHSSQRGLPSGMAWLFALLYEFSWKGGMVLLTWSGVDYALQKINYERSLRMSKQEVREEGKDAEGNPQTKSRIKRKRREMRRKQMLQRVARATVVITNPTEYAVALEYIPEKMGAPVVVAKGRGLLAQKIKREARWYEIPIMENVALAQALYRTVEVGDTIPAKLYTAVAEVLAFLYRAQANLRAEQERRRAAAASAAAPAGVAGAGTGAPPR
ncbi:MAG: EscU/YscU/HrcU family type III secretion system export apparatus switch protein [Candidatus Acidiferrales bacterium]|jgi:flagellar biosynthesis protein FlhB